MSRYKPYSEYTLDGYDKDADLYENLCTSNNQCHILKLAEAVTAYHLHNREIRCTQTKEPFDWFVICEKNTGKILRIYTAEYPEGHYV